MRVFVPIKKELVIYMDGDAGRYWQILFYILLIIGGAYFAKRLRQGEQDPAEGGGG